MERLGSEQVIIQSPFSYVGSTRRLWRMTGHENEWVRWGVLVPLVSIALLGAWILITVWYVLFSLLLIPWRLYRRGVRKTRRDELRHREMLERLGGS